MTILAFARDVPDARETSALQAAGKGRTHTMSREYCMELCKIHHKDQIYPTPPLWLLLQGA